MSAWSEIEGMITVKPEDHFSIKKMFDEILDCTDYFVKSDKIGNSNMYDVKVSFEEEGSVAIRLQEQILAVLNANKIKYDLYFNIRHAS